MDKNNYYERHHWYHEKFFFAPEARRVMDYLIENTTTYPRCVEGSLLSPGRIITTRRRICHDLGISLRDLVSALNRLDLHHLISRQSYADSIDITLPLHPDEITPPPTAETPSPEGNEVGALFKALAPHAPSPAQATSPAVGAQYIAPAQPALTPPNPPSLLNGSGQRPRQKPNSGDNFVGTVLSPCKSTPKQTNRVSGDIFIRVGVSPLAPPSKPRRGALMFSPMWQHGVPIQANKNEPRRGGIVLPSKTSPSPQPKHSKWSVALDRPIRIPNPPIRGAPA